MGLDGECRELRIVEAFGRGIADDVIPQLAHHLLHLIPKHIRTLLPLFSVPSPLQFLLYLFGAV